MNHEHNWYLYSKRTHKGRYSVCKAVVLCSICGIEKPPEGFHEHSWKCVFTPHNRRKGKLESEVKIVCSKCGIEKDHDKD